MDYSLDIFDENSKFILKYLEKKKSHIEKFDQFTLSLNGINKPLHIFMEEAFILHMESYVVVVKKSNKYFKIKLTEEGVGLVKYIKHNDAITTKSVIIKSARFIYLAITGLVNIFSHSLSLMISAKFITAIVKIITFIILLLGGAVAVLQLIKWWNTGEI